MSSADDGTETAFGELISQGTIVSSTFQPTTAGSDNSCGGPIVSGCLVVDNPSITDSGPIDVSDGFQSVTPVPAAWRGLEQTAEATIANLRGVPADRRNQYWARPEIDSLMFLDLIGLIRNKANGATLTAQEQGELDVLSTAYQDYEEKVADRAIRLYDSWYSDPCSFRVPVGDDPDAYQNTLGTTCVGGRIPGTFSSVPAPTADEFTEWVCELVSDDYRRSLVPQVEKYAHVPGAPAMTDDEADTEIESEYQNAVSSLQTGLSFLAAAAHVATNAPATTQPEATGELLETIKDATSDSAGDRFADVFSDTTEAFVSHVDGIRDTFFPLEESEAEALQGVSSADAIGYDTPIGPYTEVEQALVDLVADEAQEALLEDTLVEGFAEGLEVGGVVLGAAAVITTETITLVQNSEVLSTLQANHDSAYAAVDLRALTDSSDGWAKLENAFVDELLPDFTFRKATEPAPDGAAPAPSANDPVFLVRPASARTRTTRPRSSPTLGTPRHPPDDRRRQRLGRERTASGHCGRRPLPHHTLRRSAVAPVMTSSGPRCRRPRSTTSTGTATGGLRRRSADR